jgi:uncharacterized LabA/DUF88 family protein
VLIGSGPVVSQPLASRASHTSIFENHEYSSIRPLIDWLDYNGYTVVTKPKEFIAG